MQMTNLVIFLVLGISCPCQKLNRVSNNSITRNHIPQFTIVLLILQHHQLLSTSTTTCSSQLPPPHAPLNFHHQLLSTPPTLPPLPLPVPLNLQHHQLLSTSTNTNLPRLFTEFNGQSYSLSVWQNQ